MTVLAVPDSPINITGFFWLIPKPSKNENLVVSTVGTKILENLLSSGGLYSATSFSHRIQFLLLAAVKI